MFIRVDKIIFLCAFLRERDKTYNRTKSRLSNNNKNNNGIEKYMQMIQPNTNDFYEIHFPTENNISCFWVFTNRAKKQWINFHFSCLLFPLVLCLFHSCPPSTCPSFLWDEMQQHPQKTCGNMKMKMSAVYLSLYQ